MPRILRFAAPLAVTILGLAILAGVAADQLIGRWFQSDLAGRAALIQKTVADEVGRLSSLGDVEGLKRVFDRVAGDERVMAVGLCASDGSTVAASADWPKAPVCAPFDGKVRRSWSRQELAGAGVIVSRFPVPAEGPARGVLTIVQDAGFTERRSLSIVGSFAGVILLIAIAGVLGTAYIVRTMLANWSSALIRTLDPRTPTSEEPEIAPELRPVVAELRQALRDMEVSGPDAHRVKVDWSPETLQALIGRELANSQVIVVSNREPYIHERDESGEITVRRPASGLVTALEPITRACGGVWIAHGSGSADRDVVDSRDRVAVPPEDPSYKLRRVWLTEAEEEGYYYRFANEGLWPLCHIAFVRPKFRREDWEYYKAVNARFADAVVAEAAGPSPIVLVQDYHFALLPRLIRQRLPEATIVTFWHIPWPNSEVFSICPWREEILDGLLGSSILGFHTRFYCNNFIDTVDRFMESHIDRELSTVSTGREATLVDDYPISIEWPPESLADAAPVEVARQTVRARLGIGAEVKLGVGVERFDYTKGIPDRLRAVGILFERHPEWIGRFTFVQVAAPTRNKLEAYQGIRSESEQAAEEINARFARNGWKPIELLIRHHEPAEVMELFRAADLCVVTSLHDGMNLVAKEFVAARDDERGVLVLSTFAGASRELLEALLVNPYDNDGMGEAIDRALKMSEAEQRGRMRMMRELVRDNNVYRWAGSMLLEAARMRRRRAIRKRMVR